ncbi:hypothetical protein [Lysobacter enzymogenes]|uniref:hypothetical protein n=1 Tax=Lysobacter enzymogenes TaxID=69 RepID=UPI001AF56089|nr:hypothetical protein [Lysobacter enzymogenes]QQQ00800.1 hypothetical protein JHW41_22480 [Lysobacter enzymogenes]
MKKALLIAGFLCAFFATNASASSNDAWAEFRKDVDKACRILLGPQPKSAQVTVKVDPFGTESYGAALVTVTAGKQKSQRICIYDKKTNKAELTSAP